MWLQLRMKKKKRKIVFTSIIKRNNSYNWLINVYSSSYLSVCFNELIEMKFNLCIFFVISFSCLLIKSNKNEYLSETIKICTVMLRLAFIAHSLSFFQFLVCGCFSLFFQVKLVNLSIYVGCCF